MSNMLQLIAGVKIESLANGQDVVAGYHFSAQYPTNRGDIWDPVVTFGRKKSQKEVNSTTFITIDLPRAMDKNSAFTWMVAQPKFAKYAKIMRAKPFAVKAGSKAAADAARIAELTAKIEQLEAAKKADKKNGKAKKDAAQAEPVDASANVDAPKDVANMSEAELEAATSPSA